MITITKGNWYVCTKNVYNIKGKIELVQGTMCYSPEDGFITCKGKDTPIQVRTHQRDNFRKWAVKDAHKGDFLTYNSESGEKWFLIFLREYVPYEGHIHYYALYTPNNLYIRGTSFLSKDDIMPSTTEEKEFLLQRLKESGYGWDEENLKRISLNK